MRVFNELNTQWRVGMNGPTGLDYSAIPAFLRMKRVPRADWEALFDDVRTMEIEALNEMHTKPPGDQ